MRLVRVSMLPLLLVAGIFAVTISAHSQSGLGFSIPKPAPAQQAPASAAQQHLTKGVQYQRQGNLPKAIAEFKELVRLAPNSPVGYYQLGMTYLMKGDTKSADPNLRKVAKFAPSDATVRLQIAELYMKTNHPVQALEFAKQAATLKPKDARVRFMLGAAYLGNRNVSGALQEFKTVVQLDPKNFGAYYNTAIIYVQQQNYAGARQALAKAAALQPKNDQIIAMQAAVEESANKKDPSKAISLYQKALTVNPENDRVRFALGILYDRAGRTKEALSSYEKVIANNPLFMPAKINAARIYIAQSRVKNSPASLQKAIVYLKPALKIEPKNPGILELLGMASLYSGDNPSAETYFSQLRHVSPESPAALQGLAYIYETQNKTKEAAELVAKLRDQNPGNADLNLRLARLYDRAGDDKKAAATYQTIAEKFPKNTDALSERAAYLLRKGQKDKAAEQYRAVVKLKPDDLQTQMSLAGIYSSSEDKADHAKAVPELEIAKKIAAKQKPPKEKDQYDPRMAPFVSAADMYEKDGDKEKVVAQYMEALKLDPKSTQMRISLARFYEKDNATLDKAIEEYRTLIAADRDNQAYYSMLAVDVEKRSGKRDDAVAELRKYIDQKPPHAAPRYALAVLLLKDNTPESRAVAIKEYQDALVAKPDDVNGRLRLAQLYVEDKKTVEAEEQFRQVLQKDPGQAYALTEMQKIIDAKNDPKATADWLTTLKAMAYKKQTPGPDMYGALVDAYTKAKRGKDAVAILQDVSGKDPKNVPVQMALGKSYEQAGQPDKAIAVYRKVMSKDAKNADPYKAIGNVYFALGRYADALKYYRDWKSRQMWFFGVDPTQIRIAQCLENLGKTDQALAEYMNLEKSAPQDPEVQAGLRRTRPAPVQPLTSPMQPAPGLGQ